MRLKTLILSALLASGLFATSGAFAGTSIHIGWQVNGHPTVHVGWNNRGNYHRRGGGHYRQHNRWQKRQWRQHNRWQKRQWRGHKRQWRGHNRHWRGGGHKRW